MYRACQRGYWRASKRWCKALQPEAVNKALLRFANNEAGLRPIDVYGGPNGAFAQLQQLAAWFQVRCPLDQTNSLSPSGRSISAVSSYPAKLNICPDGPAMLALRTRFIPGKSQSEWGGALGGSFTLYCPFFEVLRGQTASQMQ